MGFDVCGSGFVVADRRTGEKLDSVEEVVRMKVGIILGTRPEIIKMASVIRACEERGLDYFLLHTGQHYSYEMDRLFFDELNLSYPKYNMNAGLKSFRLQIGLMLRKIQQVLALEKPNIAFVLGDTNSVLAGALAADKLNIRIGHIEAGLRSHDIAMVEETNRIITDHISDLLFCPTEEARDNLLEEGVPSEKIHVTGNTIVDAVLTYKKLAETKVEVVKRLNLEKNKYMVVTSHRPENVDVHERLSSMLEGLRLVSEKFGMPIIWPIHPRSAKMLKQFNLAVPKGVRIVAPLGYLEFLQLEANSKLVFTDSGGVQEESCILQVPSVTLRENTERQEPINMGGSVLVGVDSERILHGVSKMLSSNISWENPFGDGKSGERIVDIVLKQDIIKNA
jgi:UDP-N-acetylglucosamine 2-epimerase (non-hydrolysing)